MHIFPWYFISCRTYDRRFRGITFRGEVSCELPGDHGGNMDTNEIKEGSKVYLPIYIEGGLLQ